MAKNSLGREIPALWRGRSLDPYLDPWSRKPEVLRATRPLVRRNLDESKLLPSLRAAIEMCGLKDGMNISTHHALRNGDVLLNLLVKELDAMGLRDIGIASSSVHAVHAEIIPYIRKGVITRIETGVNGLIAELVSKGELDCPIVVRSHGGRARSLATGEVEVDAAFIAAPCCDITGNLNGVYGPSACGSLGYAHTDARYAKKVVAVTDNLVRFPASPISISQSEVDYVVKIDSLGDPSKIVSTTTRLARDPAALLIAKYAVRGHRGFGIAQGWFLLPDRSRRHLAGGGRPDPPENGRRERSRAVSAAEGITGYFVDMLEQGYFETLLDVQCFDLKAVESLRRNPGHREISASLYANPYNRGEVVNMLDCVILGATEVDVDFNVNVNTESSGYLLHNTGGHCDAAAGAKLAIVVAPSMRGRLPIVRDAVTTITTPGETVDVIVTERGICVADKHVDLKKELLRRKSAPQGHPPVPRRDHPDHRRAESRRIRRTRW